MDPTNTILLIVIAVMMLFCCGGLGRLFTRRDNRDETGEVAAKDKATKTGGGCCH